MKKVLLLLADGFETFEASVFIDVIGWNLVEGDKIARVAKGNQSRLSGRAQRSQPRKQH